VSIRENVQKRVLLTLLFKLKRNDVQKKMKKFGTSPQTVQYAHVIPGSTRPGPTF